ncbi:MAG: DUF5018 domain-containing protein [Dysgonomonas sp.]
MKLEKIGLLLLIGSMLTFIGCGDDAFKSSEKQITEFSIDGVNGSIDENLLTIDLTMPFGTDITSLKPSVKVSSKATVSPASGATVDFTSPVAYVVTAEDGSKVDYAVKVEVVKNTEAQILTFELAGLDPVITASVDEEKKVITAAVPFGTNLKTLVPTITFKGKEISPESGEAVDFTHPVNYRVTAEDGRIQGYYVTIKETKSSDAELLTFEFAGLDPKVVAKVDGSTITAEVPFGTNVTKLVPTITYKGNKVVPASGVAADFSSPVTYKVIAQDTREVEYEVVVNVIASSEAELTEFSFDGLNPRCVGVLNPNTKIVAVDVPFGTDVTKLKPTIKFKGHTVSPASGVVQDFSVAQVFYNIVAQDGKKYGFSVMVNINPFQPQITSVNRTKFANGDQITIQGHFSETGNEIMLRNSTNAPVYPTITKETSTYIIATIPSLAGAGDYNMTVRSYVGTPSQGSVLYEASKITIVDPASLAPKILSITPASIIKGTEEKVYFKTQNKVDLAGKHATVHYVKGSDDKTTNSMTRDVNDYNSFYIEVGRNWALGTYTFYLERDGYKSNEISFELKENTYPIPTITSVSTYEPVEGETITITGTNFSKVSSYDTYINVRKIVNSMGYNYPYGNVKATVVDNNTITFSLPYVKASGQTSGELDGHVGIEVVANGQMLFHHNDFMVKKK